MNQEPQPTDEALDSQLDANYATYQSWLNMTGDEYAAWSFVSTIPILEE